MTTNIDELEKLAKAATDGPWIKRYSERVTMADDTDGSKSICHCYHAGPPGEWKHNENARYIAAANPQAVLELIDRVRELEKRELELENTVQNLFDLFDEVPLITHEMVDKAVNFFNDAEIRLDLEIKLKANAASGDV